MSVVENSCMLHVSCMLGAAHGCSSCMLGGTIIGRPHATWHAPPMSQNHCTRTGISTKAVQYD